MKIVAARSTLKIVVFVGGSGTRMWPMSRASSPKQFQALVGKRTMFQQMIDHLLTAYSPDDLFISTSERHVELVKQQAPEILPDQIITEPELRDTTAAVGLAAIHIAHLFPDSFMATIWGGDHLIRERDRFLKALDCANRIAEDRNLTVQINVRPTFPSPNLGYVEVGRPILGGYGENIYEFKRQVEKPDITTARHFLASINYLWHTGYRVWNVQTLLGLYNTHVPESYHALVRIKKSLGTPAYSRVVRHEYGKIIKKAIDYTIFEHLEAAGQAVIAADLGWNDVGTWQVLKDELSITDQDNVAQGQTLLLDTTGSLVYGQPHKLTAVVGMNDVIVVDTADALLIIPKHRAADVKQVVEELKKRKMDKYT